MKKIFLALAAVAALAACSKTEYEDVQNEISFAPVTENITKAMMTGTTFKTSEEFNVWAYYKPVPAGSVGAWMSDSSTPQSYIEDKTFAYNSVKGEWAGKANPYFWPKNGSLVFVGYYPSSVTANHTLATQTMTFTDVQESRVDNTGYSEDIMYFNMTPSCSNGTVAAEFKHALSWISVLLVKDSNTSDQATITVNSVMFTEVNPSGDAEIFAQQPIKWTVDGTARAIDILEGNPVILTKGNVDVEPYQPLFIPQAMNGNLVIEYEVKSADGSKFTEVKTITLKGMKDDTNASLSSWLPAKHYTYTITIGVDQIYINPTVADWANVSVETLI